MTTPPPSDGSAHSGRRDNGLPSAEWAALVDLDPRLSAALLERLAAEGVAAYVEPARDVDSFSRASTFPSRPLDRLWVDPSRADVARGVIRSEVADLTALLAEDEPGATADGLVRPVPRTAAARVLPPPDLSPAPPDEDEVFRQIVADFGREAQDPVPRWPVSEDLDPDRPQRRRRTDPVPVDDVPDPVEPLPGWVEPERLEDDGHYVPPPPPQLPRPRLRTLAAIAMTLFGLAALFAPFRVGLDDSVISILLGLLLTGGGAGLLVAWMRDAPPTDRGPDDGAVV